MYSPIISVRKQNRRKSVDFTDTIFTSPTQSCFKSSITRPHTELSTICCGIVNINDLLSNMGHEEYVNESEVRKNIVLDRVRKPEHDLKHYLEMYH